MTDKIYELAEKLTEATNDICYRIYDKVCEIHEANQERVAKAIAHVLIKTYLKNYMYNMEMYELKHQDEDMSVKVK